MVIDGLVSGQAHDGTGIVHGGVVGKVRRIDIGEVILRVHDGGGRAWQYANERDQVKDRKREGRAARAHRARRGSPREIRRKRKAQSIPCGDAPEPPVSKVRPHLRSLIGRAQRLHTAQRNEKNPPESGVCNRQPRSTSSRIFAVEVPVHHRLRSIASAFGRTSRFGLASPARS